MSLSPASTPAPGPTPGPAPAASFTASSSSVGGHFARPTVRALHHEPSPSTSTTSSPSPEPAPMSTVTAKPRADVASAKDSDGGGGGDDDDTAETHSHSHRRLGGRGDTSALGVALGAVPGTVPGAVPGHVEGRDHHRRDQLTERLAEADSIMQLQLQERERRLRQQLQQRERGGLHVDSTYSVKVVQDKCASRSAPQRGRAITVTACTRTTKTAPRPERWSLGGPPELVTGTKSTWDIVLGQPAQGAQPASTPNGIHTLSSMLDGATPSYRADAPPAGPAADGRGEPAFNDHLVRFVYPERSCSRTRDASVQVTGPPPLQLYVLPQHRCGCRRRPKAASGRPGSPWGQQRRPRGARGARGHTDDEDGRVDDTFLAARVCLVVVQSVFCLAGLALIILILALAGAAAFHATEGPHEDQQVQELNKQQADLVIRLATDLRVLRPVEDDWRSTISRSVERHEQMVLHAAAAGYGEGGAGEGGARIWTYPGALLFTASLLTTLGFGAPVPRTPMGRLAAVVLAIVGIPLNVILALQLGRVVCARLTRFLPMLGNPQHDRDAQDKRRPSCASCWANHEARGGFAWTPLLVPVGALALYYMLGMVVFASVLALPADEWLLFPLSLTAAGGVARVPGWVRVLYAAYLEGGILLAAAAVAVLQAPATTATTDLAMRLGILDLDDYYAA